MAHYTCRGSSTSLTTLRLSAIAVDLSGGVWFPAYDDPSIARLKADGTWQQFRQSGTPVNLGSLGFAGVAVDSKNRVYFAPTNAAPIAYDVAAERWLDLPAAPFSIFFYYGVRVYQDDAGQVWSADKKKFDSTANTWATAADTSALDHRHLHFLNGGVSVDMDMSGALPPVSVPEELNMTVDSRGTIYFSGSLGNTSAGIVAFGPLNGDVDRNGTVNLADAILAVQVMVGDPVPAFAGADVNGDGKIGLAEAIFILQRAGGTR